MIRLSKLTFIPKRLLKTFAILLITSVIAVAAGRKLIFKTNNVQEDQIAGLNSTASASPIDEFIPPSPEVSALGKFIETPIGYKTGTPNINIPIHTVQDGSLQVPISLSYHASGIKASDVATWVGAGWNLNAGGQVFRTVRGLPDEQSNGYYFTGSSLDLDNFSSNAANSTSNTTFEHLNYANIQTVMDVSNRFVDGEPDIFRFILPNGKSGRFYINKIHDVIQIPKQNIKIEYSSPQTTNQFTRFTITDTDGTKFTFGTKYTNGGPRYVEKIITDPGTPDTEAAWKLVEIKNHNENETINFNYVQEDYSYYIPRTASQLDIRPAQYTNSTTTSSSNLSVKYQGSVNTVALGLDAVDYSSYKLSSISTNYETINFISNTNRVDSDFKNGTPKKLDKIEIVKGTLCKSFNLSHDYFKDPNNPSIDTKLKLLSLQEVTCNISNVKSKPPYNFHYDGTALPDAQSRAIDHWGYYNGAHGNSTFNIPSTSVPLPQSLGGGYLTKGYSNRNPNEAYMKKGSLTKINFPTGGFTEYTYEAHEYWDHDSQTNLKAGGLRIAQKKHNDGNGSDILTTTYDYSADVNQSSGYLFDKPKYFYTKEFAINMAGFLVSWRNTPINHMSDYDGSHILYSKVTEKIDGSGSTIYKFGNIGSTYSFSSTTLLEQAGYPQAPLMHYPFRGALENTELKNENNTSVSNTAFNPIQNVPFDVGDECLAVGEKHSFITYASVQLTTTYYTPRRYKIYTSDPYRLESITQTQNGLTTTTEYEYDTEFPSFVKKEKTTINGEEYATEYKYPSINSTGTVATLYTRNRIGAPIETRQLKNNKIVNATKTTFKQFGNQIVPDRIYQSEATTLKNTPTWVHKGTMKRYEYLGYLSEFKQVDGNSSALIWDGPNRLLTAKVLNAKRNEVFYSSFEDDAGANNNHAKTGKKSLSTGGGFISVDVGTLSTGDYMLSYWEKRGNTGNWEYKQRLINYVNNGNNLPINDVPFSTLSYIDEVRIHPKDALMTTYTYDIATRQISHINNENHQMARFEYDDFGRLEYIYDFDDNLVSKYEYNYQNDQLSGNKVYNYIKTWAFLTEGVNKGNINQYTTSSGQLSEQIQFMDGLGRPMQSIAIGQAANHGDIVSHMEYDNLGRAAKSFLPFVIASNTTPNNGQFVTNAANKQYIYNSALYGASETSYAESVFDGSPLNRVVEQSAPGYEWQIGNGHTMRSNWRANYDNEVYDFEHSQFYPADEVMVTEVIDENNVTSYSYTDKLGRTILTKRATNDYEIITDPKTGNAVSAPVYAMTYYQYDDFGRIVKVFPPAASKLLKAHWNVNASDIAELIYEYTYDARGRVIEKKLPGAASQYMVYDKLDRVVLTQDGNQRANNNEWSFTKYDILGRPIANGIYKGAGNYNRTYIQNYLTNTSTAPLYESISSTSGNGYTNDAFPTADFEVNSYSYYDEYDFDESGTDDVPFDGTHTNSPAFYRINGKLTGTKVKILDGAAIPNWIHTVTYYDDRGRVIEIHAENHMGGADVTSNQYDFAGKVLQTVRKHTTSSTADIYILSRFQYDHAGRVLSSTYGVGEDFKMATHSEITLSAHEYSALGQLMEKKLHSTNLDDNFKHYLQNIDYKYNIRGWMTDINDINFGGLTPIQMAEEVSNGLISKIKDSDIEIELNITDLNAGIYDEVEVRNEREEERGGQSEQRVEEESRELEDNSLQSVLTNVLSIDYTGQELTEANYEQEITKLRTDLDTQMDNLGITDQKARDLVEEEVMSYFTDNWVKTKANDNDDDLFSMHFDYTTSHANTNAAAQYNGNISQVTWRVRGDANKSSYGFQYDNLNRLTEAKYAQYDDNGVYTNIDHYSVSNISYDLNGNIKTLNRMGFDGSGFSQIDQMTYTYENNSNILKSVSDAAKDNYGFKEEHQGSTDYVYDDNGNMTEDKNKGITITYNHLNLPVKVTFDSNEEITWTYDAAGVKLRKYTDDGQGNTTEKNYVGSIEYIKGANGYEVEAIYHSEGRVIPTDAEGKYQFEYTLKDHLGNSRVTFADLDGDAVVDETEILETNHYYPFGMLHQPSSIVTGSSNAYKYNGKELNTDFGLDWLAFEYRIYDASIGRFIEIDPIADQFYWVSVYNYAENEPIANIDFHGLQKVNYKDIKNSQGDIISRQAIIRVTHKVINLSSKDDYKLNSTLAKVETKARSEFSTKFKSKVRKEDGTLTKTEIPVSVTFILDTQPISSINQVNSTDLVTIVVDEIIPQGGDAEGLAQNGTNNNLVESDQMDNGETEAFLHELGHNLDFDFSTKGDKSSVPHTKDGKGLMGANLNGDHSVSNAALKDMAINLGVTGNNNGLVQEIKNKRTKLRDFLKNYGKKYDKNKAKKAGF